MSWTLDRHSLQNADELDHYLIPIGRAIYIACHFEQKCKEVIRFARLTDDLSACGLDASIEILKASLNNRSLYHNVRQLSQLPDFAERVPSLLESARASRNWIAHEAALFYSRHIDEQISQLRYHVRKLAEGDNVVSIWLYELCEREQAPRSWEQSYVDTVERWVLEITS